MNDTTRYILALILGSSCVAILYAYYKWATKKLDAHQQELPRETVRLEDFPAIVESLASSGENGSWFVLILPQGSSSSDDEVAVQFSVESRQVGFDWRLDNELGRAHRARFEELGRRKGWPIRECESYGFRYLRIDGVSPQSIAEIGQAVLMTLYNVHPNEEISVEADAPEWRVGA